MFRIALFLLTLPLLPLAVFASPDGVYRSTDGVTLAGTSFFSLEASIEQRGTRIVLVIDAGAEGAELAGTIRHPGGRWQRVFLRETARRGTLPRSLLKQIRLRKSAAGIQISLTGKTIPLRRLAAEEMVLQGMQKDLNQGLHTVRGKGIVFVTQRNTKERKYLHFFVPVGGTLQAEYFTFRRQRPQAVVLDRWRVRLNRRPDPAWPNDNTSYFARARFPGGLTELLEFDIERHPMSWSGLRRHVRARRAPVRYTHFEPIQTFQGRTPDGRTLYAWGYRIDTTEQIRLFDSKNLRGRFLLIEHLHGKDRMVRLTDGQGRKQGRLQWGANDDTIRLFLPGQKPLLMRERR